MQEVVAGQELSFSLAAIHATAAAQGLNGADMAALREGRLNVLADEMAY